MIGERLKWKNSYEALHISLEFSKLEFSASISYRKKRVRGSGRAQIVTFTLINDVNI